MASYAPPSSFDEDTAVSWRSSPWTTVRISDQSGNGPQHRTSCRCRPRPASVRLSRPAKMRSSPSESSTLPSLALATMGVMLGCRRRVELEQQDLGIQRRGGCFE